MKHLCAAVQGYLSGLLLSANRELFKLMCSNNTAKREIIQLLTI